MLDLKLKYKFLFIILFIYINKKIAAQQTGEINSKILENIFKEFEAPKKSKRAFLKSQNKLLAKFNPLTYIFGGALYFYQNIISEQIQANCQYKTSCSENMKNEIHKKGIILGIFKGLNQLGNCAEQVKNDYPNYVITAEGKINNVIE